jgi:hypothetical protein
MCWQFFYPQNVPNGIFLFVDLIPRKAIVQIYCKFDAWYRRKCHLKHTRQEGSKVNSPNQVLPPH